jgi:excisionase family DNA binding protein
MARKKRERAIRSVVSPVGQVYTTEEVAEILKTSQRTVQRMIRLGQLKAHRVGRGYRVRDQDLKELFEDESGNPNTTQAD